MARDKYIQPESTDSRLSRESQAIEAEQILDGPQ
jgi:hypothetical protein